MRAGDYVVYKKGGTCQLGLVKRMDGDGAFVYYHCGDTAARTPLDLLTIVDNAYAIPSLLERCGDVVR